MVAAGRKLAVGEILPVCPLFSRRATTYGRGYVRQRGKVTLYRYREWSMSEAAHGAAVRIAAYALRAVLFAVAAVVAYLLLSAFDRPAHADPGLPSPVAAIPSPNLPDAAPALPRCAPTPRAPRPPAVLHPPPNG